MTDCLVTVVVPIYNVEKYLERSIESIVNQTYKNIEIILVDDGSPDNCPEICDLWAEKDNRITVIHKKNAGLGMARNTGIENANGKYIFFFDSDDCVDTSIIEKCVASAEKYNSDAVIYGRYEVYDDGRVVAKKLNSPKEIFKSQDVVNDILPAMFTYNMGFGVSACSKMFSLDTIRKHSLHFISEREIISEDAYFALEFFSRASAVSIVNECLYFYYRRDNSLSRVFRIDRDKQNDVFLEKTLRYATKNGLPRKVLAHLTARYHMYVISSIKQLLSSDLSEKSKKAKLKEIFNSSVLRSSLSTDVLSVHKGSLRVFFTLLRLRCYWVCRVLLYIKMKKL